MRKLFYAAFLAAVVLTAFGCAVTNYPVITDSFGPWGGQVMDSFYDKAYIIPSAQIATIFGSRTEELYTLVVQDWKADRRLYTYSNTDTTASVIFLDQTYCDPTRQTNCPVWVAWDPDLPDAYPTSPTGQSGNPSPADDIFDGVFDPSCPGADALSLLVSLGSRIGECGSGVWADKQGTALEFSLLDLTTFRGQQVYSLPINGSNATVTIGDDNMPLFGSYQTYLDQKLRLIVEMTPNARYQLRWLNNWIEQNGSFMDVDLTYGALSANFKLNATTLDGALDLL